MSSPDTDILDHIIHLVPPGELTVAVERFTSIGFKVLPGGTHADGLTYNALVVLADGVYLELIAFTHELSFYPPGSAERARREGHWWADKKPGWIDFAHLGTDASVWDVVNRRAGSSLYSPPVSGGRERPDGVQLKWTVTFPEAQYGRGWIPFFCEDVTSRKLRVPLDPDSNARHPSTALGIAYITILTSSDRYTTLIHLLTAVTGSDPASSTPTKSLWNLSTPHKSPTLPPQLILTVADESKGEQVEFSANGGGIYEVGFWVDPSSGRGGSSEGGPLGRVVWVATSN